MMQQIAPSSSSPGFFTLQQRETSPPPPPPPSVMDLRKSHGGVKGGQNQQKFMGLRGARKHRVIELALTTRSETEGRKEGGQSEEGEVPSRRKFAVLPSSSRVSNSVVALLLLGDTSGCLKPFVDIILRVVHLEYCAC